MQPHFTPIAPSNQHQPSRNSEDFLVVFPPRFKKATKGRPADLYFRMASRLRDAVNRTDFRHPFSSLHWARDFELLARYLEGDTARIERALEWLYSHICDPYTPRIRSASAFRKRFGDLEESMAQDQKRRPTILPTPLSGESAIVLNRLRMLEWPEGCLEQLPAAVEQSYQNFLSWYQRFSRAKLPSHLDAVRSRILATLGSVDHYLEEWFLDVWRRFHKWQAWTGDMGPHVWTAHHPRFVHCVGTEIANCDPAATGKESRDASR